MDNHKNMVALSIGLFLILLATTITLTITSSKKVIDTYENHAYETVKNKSKDFKTLISDICDKGECYKKINKIYLGGKYYNLNFNRDQNGKETISINKSRLTIETEFDYEIKFIATMNRRYLLIGYVEHHPDLDAESYQILVYDRNIQHDSVIYSSHTKENPFDLEKQIDKNHKTFIANFCTHEDGYQLLSTTKLTFNRNDISVELLNEEEVSFCGAMA